MSIVRLSLAKRSFHRTFTNTPQQAALKLRTKADASVPKNETLTTYGY